MTIHMYLTNIMYMQTHTYSNNKLKNNILKDNQRIPAIGARIPIKGMRVVYGHSLSTVFMFSKAILGFHKKRRLLG